MAKSRPTVRTNPMFKSEDTVDVLNGSSWEPVDAWQVIGPRLRLGGTLRGQAPGGVRSLAGLYDELRDSSADFPIAEITLSTAHAIWNPEQTGPGLRFDHLTRSFVVGERGDHRLVVPNYFDTGRTVRDVPLRLPLVIHLREPSFHPYRIGDDQHIVDLADTAMLLRA